MNGGRRNLLQSDYLELRRRPRQTRAIQTVSRIMDATLELVLKEGYSALTTDRIAQESKTNISSIYQYFPNKYSIVLAIYEKAATELAEMIHRIIIDEMSTPLEEGLINIMKNLVIFIDAQQVIFLRLEREIPELSQTAAQLSIDKMVYQASFLYLKHHLRDTADTEIHSKLFYLRHIVLGLVYGYIVDRPDDISEPQFIEQLSDILVDLCIKQSR